MATREFGTCFFEQYAQISLSELLGREFDSLVNMDRPDLQSPDGKSVGIEVTRAMEECKQAEMALLKDVAGITKGENLHEIDQILEYGYGFGLQGGKYIGLKEFSYWSMALPLRRIIESKVSKVGNGFYGHFDKMGLFVFSRENLGATDAVKAMKFTISLQKYQDIRYNRLYLADVDDLFVCNLDDGLQDDSRLLRYRITQEQRQLFYRKAVCRQGRDVRVNQMSEAFNSLRKAASSLSGNADELKAMAPQVRLLQDYLGSGQWLEDFEADERGEIGPDVNRSVLSEDGLYNLLESLHP